MAAAERPRGKAVVVAEAIGDGVGVAVGEGVGLGAAVVPHDVSSKKTTANVARFTALAWHDERESRNGWVHLAPRLPRLRWARPRSEPRFRFGGSGLAGRAVLAVLLTIGFYVLAIGLVIVLLAIPYIEWTSVHWLNIRIIRITLFCLGGAGAILFSIVPQIDAFQPPGERATPDSHPRLFAELRNIAAAVGEPLPAEVYLVHDINAYVQIRGGFMALGGRRVMAIGLPLMRILRISELRSVLVHEFGHYRRGHTELAPWIYRTREAIMRTLLHLSGLSNILMWPFLQYAQIFMTLTDDISRQQEYEADAISAQLMGAQARVAALRANYGAAIAYELYRRENTGIYVDHMVAGPLPDDAFMQYMQLPRVSAAIRNALEEELAHPRPRPFDSHPTLAARIAAVQKFPPGPDPSHEPLASSLLDSALSAVGSLQATMPQATPAFGALPWQDAGAAGDQFRWEDELRRSFHLLRGWTVGSLSDLVPSIAMVGGHLGTRWVPDEAAAESGRELLAGSLGLALIRAGWVIEVLDGRSVLRKGEVTIDPRHEIEQLATGALDAAAWRTKTASLGIASLRLDVLRQAA